MQDFRNILCLRHCVLPHEVNTLLQQQSSKVPYYVKPLGAATTLLRCLVYMQYIDLCCQLGPTC